MSYFFYCKIDKAKEPIAKTNVSSRLLAAKTFAELKAMALKDFLKIFSISR